MGTIARTTYGPVEGRVKEGVLLFAGVPYAAPPVGSLRFAPPQAHEDWTDPRSAQRFGNASLQPAGSGLTSSPPRRMGEDCLTLNITTPALDEGRRPVLVWIHGGGFRTGQGAIPWYNGASFAKQGDIVTVSINYRLGALGFLNLAHLGDEVASSGATGILDQVAALEWVRDNIAAFGGDPSQVTVAGESAGAMSVGVLLGCPAAAGLFRSAICQSGAAHHVIDTDVARAIAELFCEKLGVDDLEGLRAAPAERVLAVQSQVEAQLAGTSKLGATDISGGAGMPFQPSYGSPALPEPPIERVRRGECSQVSLLVGTNAHESTLWHKGETDARRLEKITGRYLADPEGALEAYRADHPDASPYDLLIAVTTDHMFRIPALRLAEAHSASGGDTWNYLFSWRSRAFGGELGATHALEIPFTFNNLERMGVDAFIGDGPLPQALADCMHTAWTAFIRDGSPEVEGAPAWPRFDEKRRALMEFADEVGVREDPFPNTRPLWSEVR
jgi:para-nitrobenzyl esterase